MAGQDFFVGRLQLADRLVSGPGGRQPVRALAPFVYARQPVRALALFAFVTAVLHAQTFDVASVKVSARPVGKDYNNQIAIGPSNFTGKNTTLKRLIVEAYSVEPPQVFGGPKWLDESE